MGDRIEKARELRQAATKPERILWSILRNRGLDGFKFRRQVPIDRYTVDFACIEARLVIELDGSQHADQMAFDEVRTRVLERCGYHVIRFWNGEVLRGRDGVIDAIRRELRRHQSLP